MDDYAIFQPCDVFNKTACCARNGTSCCLDGTPQFQYSMGNLVSVIDGDAENRLRPGVNNTYTSPATTATPAAIDPPVTDVQAGQKTQMEKSLFGALADEATPAPTTLLSTEAVGPARPTSAGDACSRNVQDTYRARKVGLAVGVGLGVPLAFSMAGVLNLLARLRTRQQEVKKLKGKLDRSHRQYQTYQKAELSGAGARRSIPELAPLRQEIQMLDGRQVTGARTDGTHDERD